ncbi:DNA methyltransferase [Exiguobacterium acetylicum]|uniref:DNA methyltransferase n=1 Tax=Exiguobacterium acetylicum TaxID=41170 RepID=UPI0038769116
MDEQEQLFFNSKSETDDQKVVCLGLTFNNDEERRNYFRNELRKKLPQLKKIEGFPIGDDEDIIRLSDPPYYTACPNPWINHFINEWRNQDKNDSVYRKEPFASDVSEGKNDPIYNAHSYHTKVPHKAIIHYLKHFTKPGDIILDGFCGTGMTGVAAFASEKNNLTKFNGRYAILNDLSPAATTIASNYNSPHENDNFELEASKILKEAMQKYDWMFETNHPITGEKGHINYTVWSDIFICNNCTEEINFYENGIDFESNKFKENICCPNCRSIFLKKELSKLWINHFDTLKNKIVKQAKQVPVLINYTVNNKRYEKKPSKEDLELLTKISNLEFEHWIPNKRLPQGQNTNQPEVSHGFTHIHDLYSKRNLIVISYVYSQVIKSKSRLLLSWLTSSMTRTTKMYKFTLDRKMGTVSGTYYIPSLWTENSPFKLLKRKLSDFKKIDYNKYRSTLVTCSSQTHLNFEENSIDYIFTDPPFGANLMYSELNFLWESWFNVETNNKLEAIVNRTQRKGLPEYQNLMEQSFRSYYKVLKPNRWMTVEFSNSKAAVWNAIQEAIQKAGFIIANVSALNKKQGSFKAVTSSTAVKQDLVISAYKPSFENIKEMHNNNNTPESAWIFLNQHLENLPVFNGSKDDFDIIPERTPRILFDRMVAFHVQNGLTIPISSAEFQIGVSQRFPIRDGMAFLESQVAEYDKKRILIKEFSQMTLFVSDENSAIEWIRQQLLKKTQTRQDLHPYFMKEIQHIAKHEQLPELDDLLSQNFLRFDDEEASVPSQILTYLRRNYPDLRGLDASHPAVIKKALHRWYVPDPNKQADLEKLREKALLREFNLYVEEMATSKKKLKVFRTEAIRAGFKKAWSEKEFQTIITVGDRLPETIIQEDDKLLMYYDNAQIKLDM